MFLMGGGAKRKEVLQGYLINGESKKADPFSERQNEGVNGGCEWI